MVFLQIYIVSVGVTLLKLIVDNLVSYTIDPSRLSIKSLCKIKSRLKNIRFLKYDNKDDYMVIAEES